MAKIKLYKKAGPEGKVQDEVMQKLTLLGWFVKETHGNMYQAGFPDVYCAHIKYGARWLEIKYAESYSFTPAQLITFPKLTAAGVGIWIATSEDDVPDLFFKPANWYTYLSIFKVHTRNHQT